MRFYECFDIIIISGSPASGKTSLSRFLSKHLNLPRIDKDTVKEILFDCLGKGDRNWSKKLGRASIEILNYMITELAKNGVKFIVESNFLKEKNSNFFKNLERIYSIKILQIFCVISSETAVQRYTERSRN